MAPSVSQLRQLLTSRGLSTTGVKDVLHKRLLDHMLSELSPLPALNRCTRSRPNPPEASDADDDDTQDLNCVPSDDDADDNTDKQKRQEGPLRNFERGEVFGLRVNGVKRGATIRISARASPTASAA